MGNQTRNLPNCSVGFQPITPPRVSIFFLDSMEIEVHTSLKCTKCEVLSSLESRKNEEF